MLGLSEHGGLLAYYTSEQYRDFVAGRPVPGARWPSSPWRAFSSTSSGSSTACSVPGTLVNLLLGRYHRPVAEERIFMFLDLNDSTAIAGDAGPPPLQRLQERLLPRHRGADPRDPRPDLPVRRGRGGGDLDGRAGTPPGQLSPLRLPRDRAHPRAEGSVSRAVWGRPRVQGRPPRRTRRHRRDRRHQEGHRPQRRHGQHRGPGRGAVSPAGAARAGVGGAAGPVPGARGARDRGHGRAGAARQDRVAPALQRPGPGYAPTRAGSRARTPGSAPPPPCSGSMP